MKKVFPVTLLLVLVGVLFSALACASAPVTGASPAAPPAGGAASPVAPPPAVPPSYPRETWLPPILSSTQQTGVWVSGQGKVTAVPDLAILSLGIEAQATTVEEARTQAAKAMTKVIEALKAHGLGDREIQTRYLSIQPVTEWVDAKNGRGGRQVIIGYKVTNNVTAKIRKLDTVGTVIDDVARAGGDLTRVQGVSFTIEDPKPLQVRARELALKDALAKAQQIAAVMSVTLGKPTYIAESGGAVPVRYEGAVLKAMPAPAAAEPPTPVSPGEMEISLSVQVTFAIS